MASAVEAQHVSLLTDLDCCDGSDESAASGTKCPNTCRQLNEQFLQDERERNEILQKGLIKKAELLTYAKQLRAKHTAAITQGEAEISAIQKKLEILKGTIETFSSQIHLQGCPR